VTAKRFITPAPLPTPFEDELLKILIEECAEVIQRATKAQRFGLAEVQPGQDLSNAQRLAQEIGDVKCMVDRLIHYRLILSGHVVDAQAAKGKKLHRYMQHQPPRDKARRRPR
jgi:NTP pyrophosphatase (non-canonical NTP hydrolase)